MLQKIDMHSHYYGEALLGALSRRQDVPRIEHSGDDRFLITPTSRFRLQGGFLSLAKRIEWLDAHGIDHQLMTFPGALGPDVLPIEEAEPLVHDVNDELAAVCAEKPRQFTALAGLPLADVDRAVAEVERACGKLRLRGIILPSNYFLSLATMNYVRPILEAANALGAHVMIHPGQRHDEDLAPRSYDDLPMHRASTIELHNGLSHAVVTLIHADMGRHYPQASVQVVNLGGAFPMLVERMDHIVETRDPDAPRPSQLIGDLVFDTASLGRHSVEMAVAILGEDKVLLGTDYPIFDSDHSTKALSSANIRESARTAVAFGNAARLLMRTRLGLGIDDFPAGSSAPFLP
jgi:aminocarboxymuconate-semialdehyde decarboxylase